MNQTESGKDGESKENPVEKDEDMKENQSGKETNRQGTQNGNNESNKGETNISDANASTSNAADQKEKSAEETPGNSICLIIVLTNAFLQSPWLQDGKPSPLLQKLMAAQKVIILKMEDGLDSEELFPNVLKKVCSSYVIICNSICSRKNDS